MSRKASDVCTVCGIERREAGYTRCRQSRHRWATAEEMAKVVAMFEELVKAFGQWEGEDNQ